MRGNWSLTKVIIKGQYSRDVHIIQAIMAQDQLEADVLPDFCTGFLYVTKPSVGAALAQAGLELYKDSEDIVITEDYLIAGVLRERLPHVRIERMETGQEGQGERGKEVFIQDAGCVNAGPIRPRGEKRRRKVGARKK